MKSLKACRVRLQRADGLSEAKVKEVINGPKLTLEGRPTKLLSILQKIGLGKIASLQGEIIITEAICRELVDQRNKVAHKGSLINEDRLYTVLFPLAQGALKYIMERDEATSE